jgi:23S rRNA pseudouridine1911/1915/1917 synthase
MGTLRFTVAEAEAGSRLDSLLATRDEIASRARAEKLLATDAVRVDGEVRAKSHRLEGGALVEVELPEPEGGLVPERASVRVLYEDPHLLVVDKPAGIAVHPGAGERRPTLAGQLLALGARGGADPERPGIVHRLDRDTSGALVASRSAGAYAALQEAIRRREVERRYLALVRGRPRSRTGRIDAPIGRDRRAPTRRSLDTAEPRDAVTRFEVRETLAEHALLEVSLETGRTHQIRVHLAAIGLPVSGDRQYGVKGDLGLERQFLHAYRLRFRHPVTREDVDVVSPLPDDLREALERARRLEA